MNSNLGKEMVEINQFSSNTNEVQMYQTGYQEERGPQSSVHLSQTSFRSVVSGEESIDRARD